MLLVLSYDRKTGQTGQTGYEEMAPASVSVDKGGLYENGYPMLWRSTEYEYLIFGPCTEDGKLVWYVPRHQAGRVLV